MTQEQHPITPPPELILEWCQGWNCSAELIALGGVATQAARWGADQELDACCEWFSEDPPAVAQGLRAARRPNQPTLKEQALEALDEEHADMRIQNYKLIRFVLESLPD